MFEGTRAASWSKTNWLFTGSHQAEDPPGGASNNQQGTTSRNTNDWHLALASPDILWEGTFPVSQDLCQQERSDAARDLPGEESLVVTLALCNAHNAAHNDDRHRSSHHHRCPHCIPHRTLNFPEFDKFQSAQTCLTRG